MKTLTMIPGDGIGYEVFESVRQVLSAFDLDLNYEVFQVGLDEYNQTGQLYSEEVISSIQKNKVFLKGPVTTPIASGFRSINVTFRKMFDLYANIRPIESYTDPRINMIIFRENTEGLYIGEEKDLGNGMTEATKRITKKGSERIIKKAFEYARAQNRKKVTCVHKANILKITDGLFLNTARELSKNYPEIEFEEMIIDNCCMQMVMNPQKFDVIVTMNLYGDILSDLGAGLVGGLGLIPSANIGDDFAMFEAVHGSAPDIANQNIANPTALLLSTAMLLDYINYPREASLLRSVIKELINVRSEKTKDLGGNLSTSQFTEKVIKEIKVRL